LTSTFVFYLIVRVEVNEVDFNVMRIVSVLNELQFVSGRIFMNYVVTATLNKSIFFLCSCRYILLDQPVRVTNQWIN
jgi:hypothetical protein